MTTANTDLPVVETTYPHRISKVSAHLPKHDLPQPGDKPTQRNGLTELLDVVSILKASKISCCVTGNDALIYYGAKRIHFEWTLCVPTFEDLATVTGLLEDKRYYRIFPPHNQPLDSLVPIYPRFKLKGADFRFQLHPGYLYLLNPGETGNVELSSRNVPYPELRHYVKSLLRTNELVDLADLIDGMNLTEEWGWENLEDLEGMTTDEEWARWKIEELVKDGANRDCVFVETEEKALAVIWSKLVRGKEMRCGKKYPVEEWETRFRPRGAGDPRMLEREF